MPASRMLRRAAMILATALALLLPPREAGAFAWVEAVDGDLPGGSPATAFSFAPGTNTVSGTAFFNTIGGTSSDFDQFRVIVPSGAVLAAISFTSSLTSSIGAPADLSLDTYLELWPSGYVAAAETIFILPSGLPAGAGFGLDLPLPAGEYLMHTASMSILNNTAASWSYQWSFTLLAVPEPSALTLLAGALLYMLALRRRLS